MYSFKWSIISLKFNNIDIYIPARTISIICESAATRDSSENSRVWEEDHGQGWLEGAGVDNTTNCPVSCPVCLLMSVSLFNVTAVTSRGPFVT